MPCNGINFAILVLLLAMGAVLMMVIGMLVAGSDARTRCSFVCREQHQTYSDWDSVRGCRCATPAWVKP